MKIKLVVAFSLMGVASSFAATGFFGDVFVVANGTSYKAAGSGGTQLSSGFGNLQEGGTFNIQGFQLNTFENDSSVVTHMTMLWTVNNFASTQQIQIFPAPAKSGNDRVWNTSSSTQNMLAGLGQGTYTFQAYYEGFTNGINTAGNIFLNNGNANYSAAFTVVPEPSAALLGAIGSLLLLRRRR